MGGGVSVAVGPMGRSADAALRLGRKGAALCYSYSLSRGAFIGEARDQWRRDDYKPRCVRDAPVLALLVLP